MHFVVRFFAFALTLWAIPALAQPSGMRVALPLGLHAGDITTTASKTPGEKFVTVENVAVDNPSHDSPQAYKPSDFHLLVGDKVYTPSVRPGSARST